jgi:hypothetical protein
MGDGAAAQRQGRQRDRASDLAQIMRYISEFLCYLLTDSIDCVDDKYVWFAAESIIYFSLT